MQDQHSQNSQAQLNTHLIMPDKCMCQYNAQSSFYKCAFELKNKSSETIYVHVTSSFGKFLEVQQNIYQLNSGEAKMFASRIRAPNQIYPHQFIGITSSPYELNNFCAFLGPQCSLSKIKLEFNTEMVEDEMIDNILKQQSDNAHNSALHLLKTGQFKNAKDLAQEAYGLYRKNINCLVTIAQAEFNLGEFAKATKIVEIFFYVPQHPEFYKAIIIKAETILYYIGTVPESIKLQVVKNVMGLLKQSIECNMADESYQNRCNRVMAKFQQIKHEMLSTKRDGLFDELLEKSVQRFDQHSSSSSLKSQFLNQQEYKLFLNKLKRKQMKSCCETPEYALDPINYEIFKQPVITPNGLSYEKQFITNFFQKHRPQDPFTRGYLDPASILNNYTLKILVRNNPNLPKWIKYQTQITKF